MSPSKVANMSRIIRKILDNGQSILVNKQSVVITFEGNRLPNEVRINSVVFPVEYYYGRVTPCNNCLRFEHVSKQCISTKALCISWGKEKCESHACDLSQVYCTYCQSNKHKSIFKDCPIYKKQVSIKRIMTEIRMSFREAETQVAYSFNYSSNYHKKGSSPLRPLLHQCSHSDLVLTTLCQNIHSPPQTPL